MTIKLCRRKQPYSRRFHAIGFTLVELLVSMTILMILMGIMVSIVSQTGAVWKRTTAKANQFREARAAFETITRHVSQATLNTYYDYFDASGNPRNPTSTTPFYPASYGRQSELRFRTGLTSVLLGRTEPLFPGHGIFFQAPLGFADTPSYTGLGNLLNTWGYYVEFRSDSDRPTFVAGTTRYRFRLMEYMQPSENFQLYTPLAPNWLTSVATSMQSHVVANNIILLVILPRLPAVGATGDPSVDVDGHRLAPAYAYDSVTTGQAASAAELNSKHQLPPVVEITMVAIDEASAIKVESGASAPNFGLTSLFKSSLPSQREADMDTLEATLVAQKLNYRVFTTEVNIRGAKWSREQTN